MYSDLTLLIIFGNHIKFPVVRASAGSGYIKVRFRQESEYLTYALPTGTLVTLIIMWRL